MQEIKTNNTFYQLQTIIKIHNDSVMNLIILKDSRFASSSCDKSIKIFNNNTYKIDIIILEHKDYVAHIYQLKDEKIISSSSDNTIKIFKLFKNTYNVEQILEGHSKPVKKTIELINGSLVSCSWDKTIKIWQKDNNNTYKIHLQFKEMLEIHSVYEINNKEFISISSNNVAGIENEEDKRALSFYKIKNGEFDIDNIIDNINISGFQSNTIKIKEKYILIGGEKKIYFIDINTHSIEKIYELDKNYPNIWFQSLYLLSDGNIIVGGEYDLFIFKIKDENLELFFDIKNIQQVNFGDHAISSIIEDLNNNIIISLYNGEIKILKKRGRQLDISH